MRSHGTLTRWNEDRGFGFITPADKAEPIFVHISAFPRDGVRPRIDELISFETEIAPDGRKRAIRIMRPRSGRAPVPPPIQRRARPRARLRMIFPLIAVLGGAFVLAKLQFFSTSTTTPPETIEAERLLPPMSSRTCDGRTMCSQMTSCDEATFFIRNCPNTQMDGDNDGIPCESQWCGR